MTFYIRSTFENYFIKTIEHFFRFYMASSKHSGAGTIPRLRFKCLEFFQPSSCLDEAMKTRKRALLLKYSLSKYLMADSYCKPQVTYVKVKHINVIVS